MHRPLEDKRQQQPIADVWRPTLRAIVKALAEGDYELSRGLPSVTLQCDDTPQRMREYVDQFGETLTELPDATWDTSVAQWMESHWDVLVDLWTVQSGRSDLILELQVSEVGDAFRFEVCLIYVP